MIVDETEPLSKNDEAAQDQIEEESCLGGEQDGVIIDFSPIIDEEERGNQDIEEFLVDTDPEPA